MGSATGVDEFSNARLGDERLKRRLVQIGDALASDPSASFPDAMASDGDLEALYRFLSNRRVSAAAILEPHIEATAARAMGRTVAIVHDSTDFVFSGASGESLGFIPRTTQRGFVGHFALAVGDKGDALGVLGLETLFFENRIRGVVRRNRSAAQMAYRKKVDKASLRWDRMVEQTRRVVGKDTDAIHVMDREGDNYRLLAAMIAGGDRFIVRARHDRRPARTDDEATWETVGEVARRATFRCEREVPLSKRRRDPRLNATYRAREARTATLQISASRIVIKSPGRAAVAQAPRCLELNLVRVHEVEAPPELEQVEWLLLTTEPVDNQAQAEAVVDWYRRRWVVEEYFRALKTGCGYERRQLESRDALLRALALLVPIAWQLLALRDTARLDPKRPARSLLRPAQLAVLRTLMKGKLAKSPSAVEAMLAVASQGGHLKRNGKPGWQTLGKGMEKLWWAELGYLAAVEQLSKK
jgi:IS4 transposase